MESVRALDVLMKENIIGNLCGKRMILMESELFYWQVQKLRKCGKE